MIAYDVFYESRPVGKVSLTEAAGNVRFDAVCYLEGDAVLRLYGAQDERFLPIGVLAPHDGCWHIGRTLSRQTLREHGFAKDLPTHFLLSEQPPQRRYTGDPLIDAALENKAVTLQQTADGFEISCPFDPIAPSPLAFALTACRIENARAVLRISG